VKLVKRGILLLVLALACVGCNASSPAAPLELLLTASATRGEAPLVVHFSARTTPEASRYTWTVAGRVLPEGSADLVYTFESPGLYVVGVRAERGAQAAAEALSVQVVAPAAELPPPSEFTELSVTQTPGGPAPWAVRYEVLPVIADPERAVRGRCSDARPFRVLTEGVLTCLHEAGDEASFELLGAGGRQRLRVPSGVTPPADGVAFAGRWRYHSRGVTETFDIVRGTETSGRGEGERFHLFVIEERGSLLAEFTLDGRTVVLEPLPEGDGRQVFFGSVYGLTLERLE
jgi:hypothetical protein